MMKDNQTLEYHEKQQFNSENLQQYDNEGQRYFLAYLLRKGYNLEIKREQNNFCRRNGGCCAVGVLGAGLAGTLYGI